jgi:hypothetical protein
MPVFSLTNSRVHGCAAARAWALQIGTRASHLLFECRQVDLEAALAISPDDKAIPSKLALLAKKEKQYEQKEKKVFAKMFAPSKDAAPSSKEHGHAHGGAAVAHGHAHDSDDACCAEGHGHVHVGELEPEHSHGHGHGHGSETQATASVRGPLGLLAELVCCRLRLRFAQDARQDRADRLGASPMVTEEPTAAGAAPQQESAESMHKSTYKW